jgi:hypothetical protein
MSTTAGKVNTNEAPSLMATERKALALLAVEAQFEPDYIVEGATVILFRNSTWGK